MRIAELQTPALLVDVHALDHNLATMARALPGPRLRPHVKAHKCTELARRQAAAGHRAFTCATIREVEGMAAAGLGEDLLLANEVLDARRLGALADTARVTVAVDSAETVAAAAAGGVREVLVDVNVGLPRCGCAPGDAGRKGRPTLPYAVSISAYEPAWISVATVLSAYVPVPPAETMSPPTSAAARASSAMHPAVSRARSAASSTSMRWPS